MIKEVLGVKANGLLQIFRLCKVPIVPFNYGYLIQSTIFHVPVVDNSTWLVLCLWWRLALNHLVYLHHSISLWKRGFLSPGGHWTLPSSSSFSIWRHRTSLCTYSSIIFFTIESFLISNVVLISRQPGSSLCHIVLMQPDRILIFILHLFTDSLWFLIQRFPISRKYDTSHRLFSERVLVPFLLIYLKGWGLSFW